MEFNYFYDIKLDDNGQIYLELISKKIVSEYKDGKNISYYVEVSREIDYPEDIKKRISYLRALGYKSILAFESKKSDLTNLRSIDGLLAAILKRTHILLDKVYDDKAVLNGMNVIATYLHYIDATSGVEYAKPIGCRDCNAEDLLQEGYTPIENSILMANISNLPINGYLGIELDVSSREIVRN